MIVIFCLRVAVGLMAGLMLLLPATINPRFYRAQFWIVLGLLIVAMAFARETVGSALMIIIGIGILLSFAGSVAWSLEGAPAGWVLSAVTGPVLLAGLVLAEYSRDDEGSMGQRLAVDAASAALLGAVMTAMLLGHFYLIAPGMSLTPLLRLLAALAGAVLARMVIAAVGLWSWTAEHSLANLTEVTVLWLPLRWGFGFLGPLVLAWMAWQAARIRSTQAATGILYVAVVFCFLGELTGQLLWSSTGTLL